MELRHLRYFVVLAEELHFGRAAARLGISQPPLSQQIMALEQELGTQLLVRSARRVELTPAGRLFWDEARAALVQAARAMEVARRAQRGEVGELGIGMFPSAPLIPKVSAAIRAYRRRYPDVQLRLEEFESRQQIQAVAEGQVQVAITRSAALPSVPPGVVASELLRERLVVIMPHDHPLAQRCGELAVAALCDAEFVFYGSRMGLALPGQVTALCQAAGFTPRVSQIAGANATIIGLVAAGMGIAIVPEAMARLRHEAVVARPVADAAATTRVWVVRRQQERSPLVPSFLDFILSPEHAAAERAADGCP
jgi:DNA-binding transcriptional LysR family regulator